MDSVAVIRMALVVAESTTQVLVKQLERMAKGTIAKVPAPPASEPVSTMPQICWLLHGCNKGMNDIALPQDSYN